jgi:N-methylhydantoinase B
MSDGHNIVQVRSPPRCRNAFVAAQDMNATLIRSSYTPIIYEGKDCSVAILDEHGDVLGQSLGLRSSSATEICVKLAAELYR